MQSHSRRNPEPVTEAHTVPQAGTESPGPESSGRKAASTDAPVPLQDNAVRYRAQTPEHAEVLATLGRLLSSAGDAAALVDLVDLAKACLQRTGVLVESRIPPLTSLELRAALDHIWSFQALADRLEVRLARLHRVALSQQR